MGTFVGMLIVFAVTAYAYWVVIPAKISRTEANLRRMPKLQMVMFERLDALEQWRALLRFSFFLQFVLTLLFFATIW